MKSLLLRRITALLIGLTASTVSFGLTAAQPLSSPNVIQSSAPALVGYPLTIESPWSESPLEASLGMGGIQDGGLFAEGAVTIPFGDKYAATLVADLGAAIARITSTVAMQLNETTLFKASADFNSQNIDLAFAAGNQIQRASQLQVGGAIEKILESTAIIDALTASAYYTYAPSKYLGVKYYTSNGELYQDFQNMAGSQSYVVTAAMTTHYIPNTELTVGANASTIHFDTSVGNSSQYNGFSFGPALTFAVIPSAKFKIGASWNRTKAAEQATIFASFLPKWSMARDLEIAVNLVQNKTYGLASEAVSKMGLISLSMPLGVDNSASGRSGYSFTKPQASSVINYSKHAAVPEHNLPNVTPDEKTQAVGVSTVVVSASLSSLVSGDTQAYGATATLDNGNVEVVTDQATWVSSNTSVATIDSHGVATAVSDGSTNITATFEGVTSSPVGLTVTGASLTSIDITPTNATIAAGLTQAYTATGHYSDSSTQNLTSSVTWSSSDTSKATIVSGGVATGVAAGTTSITATSGLVTSNSSVLTVTSATLSSISITPSSASVAAGLTQAYTATGHYSDSSTQNLTSSVTWSSSDTSKATIVSGGVATGVAAGATGITATSGLVTSNSSVLTVTSATLSSISITPSSASVAVGLTQAYTATGHYSDSSTQDLTSSVTWSSSDTSKATIASGGMATGVAVGTTNITATSGLVASNSSALTVTVASLTSISIAPTSSSVALGLTQAYTATGHYSDGSTQDLTSAVGTTWASSVTAVASISSSGLATVSTSATVGGTTNITATNSSVTSNTAILTAAAAVLESIAVTPGTASIPLGLTQQYLATGTFSDGSTQDLTNAVGTSWSSSDTTTATISSSGLASVLDSATVSNSTTITATNNSISGTATLTAAAAVIVSITVTPANHPISNGSSFQYAATATMSNGSTEDVTSTVSWSITNSIIASVINGGSNSGKVTGLNAGTTNVNANQDGVTGSTPVIVT